MDSGPDGSATVAEPVAAPRPGLDDARAHHAAGRLEAAVAICRDILAVEPQAAQALHLLGVIACQVGQSDQASRLIRLAIASDPAVAVFHRDLGNVLGMAGDRASAILSYRAAVVLDPGLADVHYNLGVMLEQQGDLVGAAESYQRTLALGPNLNAHCNLGNVLAALGDRPGAVAQYRSALTLNPEFVDVHYNLGVVLEQQGDLAGACESYRRVADLSPNVAAYASLGRLLLKLGRSGAAVEALRRRVALTPDAWEAHNDLAVAQHAFGTAEAAVVSLEAALALAPDNAVLGSSLLYMRHLDPTCSRDTLLAESLAWGRRHAAPLAKQIRPHRNTPAPDRRLRVGYLTAGLNRHPVGNFLAPILAAHDPAQVEVFAYANDAHADEVTARLRSMVHHWRDVIHLDDGATADLVRADGIDVLIDMMGHTGGHRLLVFARKPAPVQATWLGYYNTTGIPAMDYIVADRWVCPEEDDSRYVERIARLPNGYLCYSPLVDTPEPGEPPLLRRGYPTFGCFNNLAKVSSEVVTLWAMLLQRVPNGRLLLKAPSLDDAQVRARLIDEFAAHGVGPERLDFLGSTSQPEHLAAYADVDVALDPFPHNGGTTTAEALWMGVPVVALAGDRFVSRVGVSILNAAGLGNLITASPSAYVDLAASLATDASRLVEVRAGLRARLAQSALCDSARFTHSLEAAYREMWRRWCLSARG